MSIVLIMGRVSAEPLVCGEKLSIDQAVAMAVNNNAAVQQARAAAAAARARIGEVRADLYPQIQGSANFEAFSNIPTFNVQGPPGVPSQSFPVTNSPTNLIGAIATRQNVYTGGRVSSQISRTEALYDVALSQLATAQTDVALQVRQAYYLVLLNQALVRSGEETLRSAQQQLADARARFEAGTAARFDVLRAETQVSTAQENLVRTRNNVEVSRVRLNRALNANLGNSYELTDPGLAKVPAENLDNLINVGKQQRAEILAARASVRAAEYGIRVARSAAYPQLGVGAVYQLVTNENPSATTGWTFTATLSQEIFDAGRIRSTVKEAKALRDEAKVGLENTLQEVEQNVRQSYLDLLTARQTLDTSAARLAQATEAYDVAVVRYQSGVSTATELADALSALAQARANADTARFDFDIAYASLQRALGRSTY